MTIQALTNLDNTIQEGLNNSFGKVLSAFLDCLDKKLEHITCSYAKALGFYISYKLIAHHACKHEVFEDYSEAKTRARDYRNQMYSSPCKVCSVCKSRRKPWPV